MTGCAAPSPSKGPPPYYVALGLGHDALVQCKDCRTLVPHAVISVLGTCPGCGSRTFIEVRALSLWEWVRIRVGWIDFPHRQAFLKEFSHGR